MSWHMYILLNDYNNKLTYDLIPSQNYLFLFCVCDKTFESYSVSKFPVYSTVPLTVVTML